MHEPPQTIADSLALIASAHPRADFPDETARAYALTLADLEPADVYQAVRRLIAGSKYLPTVSEIREQVAEAHAQLPTASEAWEILLRGDLSAAPPEIQAAARSVGGRHAVATTTNPTAVRAQFDRDYAERRRVAILHLAGALPHSRAVTLLEPGESPRALPPADEERIRPRPVMGRILARFAGHAPEPPTEEERRDAIEILRDTIAGDEHDPLLEEATRVLDWWGR